jgi:hypothetical protein
MHVDTMYKKVYEKYKIAKPAVGAKRGKREGQAGSKVSESGTVNRLKMKMITFHVTEINNDILAWFMIIIVYC